MRLFAKLALCASLPFAVSGWTLLCAQSSASLDSAPLLSREQGQALVDFALQHGRRHGRRPDCSHLVHKIYMLAGLNYPYTDSRHLYRGTGSFARVSRPQPGDLIVWLGHVGIVVSPREQTFFSSTNSGIVTESWTMRAWKRRGHPRFFRYRISPATDQTLLADLMLPQSEDDGLPASTRSPDPAYARPDRRNEKVFHSSSSSSSSRATPTRSSQGEFESPSVAGIVRRRGKPTKHDIAAALDQNGRIRAQDLIAGELLDLARPVSLVERVEVRKLKVNHGRGSITVRFKETLSLADGKIVKGKTVERKLSLHYRYGAWVISDPQKRLYLPQDQALSVFEKQAELFLQRAPDAGDTRTVVKTLDMLFDNEPAGAERAAVK